VNKINWISVQDSLPQDKERVIIWDKNCHVFSCEMHIQHIYIASFRKGEHKQNGPWFPWDSGFGGNLFPWCWEEGPRKWFSQDVTHWAPLPHYSENPNLDD
jgi:hypothetical protein